MTPREARTLAVIQAALAEAAAKSLTKPADVALVVFMRLKDEAMAQRRGAVTR